jgi:hypothetical protein
MTLYVTLDQDYDALVYYSENLDEDVIGRNKTNIPIKNYVTVSTITDALRF